MRPGLGDRQGIGESLNNLGIVARCLQDYVKAYSLHSTSLEMFRVLGDKWNEALAISNLTYANWQKGHDMPIERLYVLLADEMGH